MKKVFWLLAIALPLLTTPPAARAQLNFTLGSTTLLSAPGERVTFRGLLTNTLPGVDLVGSTSTLSGAGVLDDTAYFPFLFPSPLPTNYNSGLFNAFDVIVSPGARPGSVLAGFYSLEFVQNGQPLTRTATFSVQVAVPEPGSLPLLAGALPLIGLMGLRLHRGRA